MRVFMLLFCLSVLLTGTAEAGSLPNKVWNNNPYDGWISSAIAAQGPPKGDSLGKLVVKQTGPQILLEGQGPLGLPKDLPRICPKFSSLPADRRVEFWRRLL